MHPLALAFLVALAGAPSCVQAQAPKTGPNGGTVVVADGHEVELVSTGTDLVIFLFDEDRKPTGARPGARAVVQDGGKTATVALAFAAPNRLSGTLAAPLGAGARVVVSAVLADGHAVQARFTR